MRKLIPALSRIDFIQKSRSGDIFILAAFTILMTLQPYFLHAEIIMMETGIHLPAINALFHGAVPYRDFFFLRGPFELYVPALMMKLLSINSFWLPVFYYGGTVLTLLFCILIARQLYRTRIVLYLMIIALVARTFPRVSFYYWGGMRYAVGFLGLWFLILFLKSGRKRWIFAAGVVSAAAFLTTIEAGICLGIAILAAMGFAYICKIFDRKLIMTSLGLYAAGFAMIVGPYALYLWANGALTPFMESSYAVVRYSGTVFPDFFGIRPKNLGELFALFIPTSKFFKYMTPAFCFMFLAAYLVQRARHQTAKVMDAFLFGMLCYGLVLYLAAFRKIEGHHFEMALQAEKFLLFFLLEEILLALKISSWKPHRAKLLGNIFLGILIISTVAYAIPRFNHRFPAVKWVQKNILGKKVKGLSLLENTETAVLNIKRGQGLVVPRWQAEEIEEVVAFLEIHTAPQEYIFCYPEVGNFYFWADRPFIGRFPIVTFSWMSEGWHREMVEEFKKVRPRYVVMTNPGDRTFPSAWYFRYEPNRGRFQEVTDWIMENYEPVRSFTTISIYRLKPLSSLSSGRI